MDTLDLEPVQERGERVNFILVDIFIVNFIDFIVVDIYIINIIDFNIINIFIINFIDIIVVININITVGNSMIIVIIALIILIRKLFGNNRNDFIKSFGIIRWPTWWQHFKKGRKLSICTFTLSSMPQLFS